MTTRAEVREGMVRDLVSHETRGLVLDDNFVRIFEPDAALRREYAAGMLGSRSLAETFDPAANGITLLRLSLALVVVFSHAFKIGAFGADPGEVLSGGQTQLGTVAVAAFMVLSGFLVTRSRETAGARRFAWRRLLRVMPAYWVCLAVTAFVVAPAAALAVGGGVEPGEALGYVTGNALLVHLVPGVGSAFASDPYAYIANGSLWTLAPEAACYIVILCIPRRYLRTVAPGLLAGLAVVHLARMTGADPSIIAVDFPLEFALGACAWLFRDRIPMLRSVAVLALIATVVALGAGAFISLGIVPLAYLVLWVSVSIRRSIRTDLSYGVYLYAFPLQQLAAAFGLHALGFAPFLAIGMGSSLAVASLSWRFVERPAMAMKRLSWRLAAPQPAAETSLSLTERAPAK